MGAVLDCSIHVATLPAKLISKITCGGNMERSVDRADTEELAKAAEKLVQAINTDNGSNGGLLSRETIRASDELRVLILRYRGR